MRRIARATGLSVATVSRALADGKRVAPATRMLVLQAACENGYGVRHVVRDGGRLLVVLSAAPGEADRGTRLWQGGLLAGLAEGASALGGRLALVDASGTDPAAWNLDRLVGHLGERPSVVFLLRWRDPASAGRLAAELPCASSGGLPFGLPIMEANVDHEAAVATMLGHMMARNHRRFGVLVGTDQQRREHQRLGAVVAAVSAAGLPPLDLALVRTGMADTAQRLLAATRAGTTAWISTTPVHACSALAIWETAGIAVPADVSLCSFLIDELDGPRRLAGVRGNFRALGRAAALALLGSRDPTRPPARLLIAGSFVNGSTLGPAPGRALAGAAGGRGSGGRRR